MSTKLYVGNLAETASEKGIRELFESFGQVNEVAVLRGFGFVHFRKSEDAEAAREALNESDFMGTRIQVQVSRTKGHGFGGRGGGRQSGGRDGYRGHDRGRYGESNSGRGYDRGHDSYGRYGDRHSDRYHNDRDRYSSSNSYNDDRYGRYSDYRERDYDRYDYGYSRGRSRSPSSRDYYRDSCYARDSYRDGYGSSRDSSYRDYDRDHYRQSRY